MFASNTCASEDQGRQACIASLGLFGAFASHALCARYDEPVVSEVLKQLV